ncbi:RNA-binding protein BRN1-like isoform X2 [Salvia hispanica]|uniref:RNA-binding protein BRN1-like isoform X2 n=1 Tax=Salvia hispanica TaxID=49212 RepID=UPI002009999F|nr:RNA-binding protein BRN1-like isoform X2 [Salvia hispanica]
MAEGESVKLFVGQVPKPMSEVQLLQLLRDFALVDEVKLIRDKETRASRGCCFAICPSREEADKAVNACHEKITLPGASRLLQMKYADGELERLEHKLFVGMLPKTVSDAEVSALFSVYGTIKDLQILRGSGQTSKGCAFLKFETKEQALAAIEALNGKHKIEGSSIPLVVKWADTEKERQTRKVRKALLQASTLQIASGQHHAVYGALPMSYVPAYNGYGYQTPGPYNFVRYRLPQLQNRPTFPNLVPTTDQGRSIRGAIPDPSSGASPSNYAAPSANYIGSAYPTTPGVHYPWTHPRAIMNNQQFGASSTLSPSSSVAASRVRASSAVHVEGPRGANLFIFHIPQQYGDIQLANLFQRFGRVLSAKVFVDKATNVSKCFGFVSYDSPAAAQNAISAMNGYQLGGKKLKVQLKRESNKKNLNFEIQLHKKVGNFLPCLHRASKASCNHLEAGVSRFSPSVASNVSGPVL